MSSFGRNEYTIISQTLFLSPPHAAHVYTTYIRSMYPIKKFLSYIHFIFELFLSLLRPTFVRWWLCVMHLGLVAMPAHTQRLFFFFIISYTIVVGRYQIFCFSHLLFCLTLLLHHSSVVARRAVIRDRRSIVARNMSMAKKMYVFHLMMKNIRNWVRQVFSGTIWVVDTMRKRVLQ